MLICSKTEEGRYHILVKKAERNPSLCLFKVELNDFEKNDKMNVLWSSNTLKSDNIRPVLGPQFLGIIWDDESILYIYDLLEERYSGFIDLKKVIPEIKGQSSRIHKQYVSDVLFCRNHAKGSLIVYFKDTALLFSQINTEYLDSLQDEFWTLIHRFDDVLNLTSVKSVKMEESYYGKLLFIINNKYFLSKSRFLTDVDANLLENKITNISENNKKKVSFEGLFTIFQDSKPIYHPQLLKQFFLKGHINLVLKILCKLCTLLKLDSKGYRIPSFWDFSLDTIVKELKLEDKDQQQKKEEPKKAKDTAASLFDDMFSWDNDKKDTSLFGFKNKKEEKKQKDPNAPLGEEEFEEVWVILI